MSKKIWVNLVIGTGEKEMSNNVVHNVKVYIDCDANVESVVEELSALIGNWATTWLKYPGTVTIKKEMI